jgi:hypothetical protein
VLFVEKGRTITVKVADFGISKMLDENATSYTMTSGTQLVLPLLVFFPFLLSTPLLSSPIFLICLTFSTLPSLLSPSPPLPFLSLRSFCSVLS